MSSSNILHSIVQSLTAVYTRSEATAVARILGEDMLGLNYTDMLIDGMDRLSVSQRWRLSEALSRLRSGEPVQYVTGQASFMGHVFAVSPAVLIPRPETEDLVQLVIDAYAQDAPAPRLCDACTGSGCIAVSLKLGLPTASVSAFDLSEEALEIARANAARLGADVELYGGDLSHPESLPGAPLDVMVSNPPYVRQSEEAQMTDQVRDYEPRMALFVPDADALCFYRWLGQWARRVLVPGGRLYCEVNEALADDTAHLLVGIGLTRAEVRQDRYGKKRFVVCTK